MDTRHKILPAAAVAGIIRAARGAGGVCRLVVGYFDPLTAVHARRLSEVHEGAVLLVALVRSPECPLLPGSARAELVAALRTVDYVVLSTEDEADLLSAFERQAVRTHTEVDRQATDELMRRVHERQQI